jgi:CRISPR-associated protein Cas2
VSSALLCLLVYDIPDDRRRNRIFKLLKQYGQPMQLSAFEARLSLAERKQLMREVSRLLDTRVDRFVLYAIGKEQERGILSFGPPRPEIKQATYYLV